MRFRKKGFSSFSFKRFSLVMVSVNLVDESVLDVEIEGVVFEDGRLGVRV